MSQPDLINQLREARPVAPAELREHVRRIAAEAAPEPRRPFNWRRAFLVAVPVAAAAIAAAVLIPGGSHRTAVPVESLPSAPTSAETATSGVHGAAGAATGSFSAVSPSAASAGQAAVPAPSRTRTQRYGASLELRVPSTQAVSDDTKQAVQITRSLGGYASSLNVDASGKTGYATLVLRIPKQNVQKAVTRLSALGTIVGESVSIQDLQNQVDATDRKIARFEHSLAGWQALPPSVETQRHIDSLGAAIAKLKRGVAAMIRTASYASVDLQLTTRAAPAPAPHKPGPLHDLAVAFRWAGIGAIYALALGTPVAVLAALCWLVARTVRRRREESLLSRP